MDEDQIKYFVLENLKKMKKNYNYRNIMGSMDEYFSGVFSNDEITGRECELKPFVKSYNYCFICNTNARKNTSIGHWVLFNILFIKSKKLLTVRFFDSFGLSPQLYGGNISSFIRLSREKCLEKSISHQMETMKKPIQHSRSYYCGPYTAFGAVEMWVKPFVSLLTIFRKFKNYDKKLNDNLVGKYINNAWPNKFCFSRESYNRMTRPSFLKEKYTPFCPKAAFGGDCLEDCRCIDSECRNKVKIDRISKKLKQKKKRKKN